MLAGINGIPW